MTIKKKCVVDEVTDSLNAHSLSKALPETTAQQTSSDVFPKPVKIYGVDNFDSSVAKSCVILL